MKKMSASKGFTLIELMIVVAIIGILAAIAIPRFADLIRKSKEGATKGSIGSIRTAISVYYGENEGAFPKYLRCLVASGATSEDDTSATVDAKYLDAIPVAKVGAYGHADTNRVVDDTTDDDDLDFNDWAAGWCYGGYDGAGKQDDGKVCVACTHTDTKREAISGW
jgi:prepilin-type N-terminal cleavage/methylation domain-containing protein